MKTFPTGRSLPSAFAAILAAALALPALLGTGCEGTSSGVDNPGLGELTVSFRGPEGAPVRVTGDLDVYAMDQNPAVEPEPLATVRIRNSAFTNLTGEDFRRINLAVNLAGNLAGNLAEKAGAAGKRSASGPRAAVTDSPMVFNLVFRSEARTGSMESGLAYDPASKAFSRLGAGLARIDIEPRPLVRYEARLLLSPDVHGDVGRVYIPGTPFQSALSDSGFAFEALPPGVFGLRLLGGDGRIFAVRESLDTRVAKVFTPDSVPVSRIDPADSLHKTAPFTVSIAGASEALVGTVVLLDAKLAGADPADKRLGILWRVLHDLSADTATILSPHALKSQAVFHKTGVHALELAVSLGAAVARDTLRVSVREVPAVKSRILAPAVGETLLVNQPYKILWESDFRGLVTVQLSTLSGKDGWQSIGDSVASLSDVSPYTWTPSGNLAGSLSCSIRILRSGTDSVVALMDGTFSILK